LSHALFSSFDVDQGTRLLLKAVARDPVLARSRRVLDEGCGVGVIGLCVAKAFPEADVVLRDRDSLAAAFAERNRLLNKLKGVTAWKDPATGTERVPRPAPRVEWGLLGDGNEGGPYDFVLSNLPAKAGAPVLASFFSRLGGSPAGALLAPGGRAAVVIVKPLAESALGWIAEAGLSVVSHERGSGHDVYVVERAPALGAKAAPAPAESPPVDPVDSDLGEYRRGESRFKLADFSYRASGFWGLPEFDTPGYGSSVSAEVLARVYSSKRATLGKGEGGEGCPLPRADVLLIEPGVGHTAIWAARELRPERLTAASRDALALEAVGANLSSLPERARPAYVAMDSLGLDALEPGSFDLVVDAPAIVPERDWTAPAWERARRLIRPGGVYLACCSPTESTRLEKRKPTDGGARWSLLCRKRKKGFVAVAWRRD
jgi:hypothetical protein